MLALRASLDAAGFPHTKLIVMDGGYDPAEAAAASANASYREAIYGAGLHYPCDRPEPDVEALGWVFWASEDYSRDPAWDDGGSYWGQALNLNYIFSNNTATIAWSLIWSAYTNLVCNGAGLMRAHTPWSGNYEASAPIWMSAHLNQFVAPGWRYLGVNGGGSGILAAAGGAPAGSFVSLVPPAGGGSGLTLIVETLGNTACKKERSPAPINASFTTAGGLPGAGQTLQVWLTTRDAYFVRQPDVTLGAGGAFSLQVPADAILTASTTQGAAHGGFPASPIPPAAPWALPYADDFSGYAEDAMARFFADQGGSWAVCVVALRAPPPPKNAPRAHSRIPPIFTHTHTHTHTHTP